MSEPTKAEICETIREAIDNTMPSPGRILEAIKAGVSEPMPTSTDILDAIHEGVRKGTREAIGAYLQTHPDALKTEEKNHGTESVDRNFQVR